MSFVLRLEKGCYLYQFGQYAWTHLILLFVFVPSSFFVSNIFDGIIWFLLPCSLVIINDIGAYLAGAYPTPILTCAQGTARLPDLAPGLHVNQPTTLVHSVLLRSAGWARGALHGMW